MKNVSGYVLGSAFLLTAWQLGAWWAGHDIIAGPWTVLCELAEQVPTETFRRHLAASSFRIFAALAVSFVTAVPLGLFLAVSPTADKIAVPLIYLTYPVPKIVLLPVVFLVFGLGDAGKVAMLSIILFFQLLISTRDAGRGISRAAVHSLYSLGGNRRHLVTHVIWPSSLPAVFTALRIATATVVAVLFFVESIGTRYGMGFYIIDAWGRADIPEVFTGMVVLALLGVALYQVFDALEKYTCRWKQV